MKKSTSSFLAKLFFLLACSAVAAPEISAQNSAPIKETLKLEISNGHSVGVLATAVSTDGKFALTGSEDWTALLWDAATGRQLRRFVGHEAPISAVAFSNDAARVLTADENGWVFLWETATGRRIRGFRELVGGKFVGHVGRVNAAAIAPDGRTIATAGVDGTARIFDLTSGRQLLELKHAGSVVALSFSPDARFLLTAGTDAADAARLFSTATGAQVKTFAAGRGRINTAAFSPDGKSIVTGGNDQTARIWNAETGAETKKFDYALPVFRACFSSDGKKIFAGHLSPGPTYPGEKKFAVLRDAATGTEIWSAPDEVRAFSIFPNSEKFMILSEGEAKFVDLSAPSVRRTLRGETLAVNSIAASPDARFLLTGGVRATSAFWNLTNGLMSQPWSRGAEGQTEDLRDVAFSADGKRFAFASGDHYGQDGDAEIYETETLKQLFSEKIECGAVALSSGGDQIVCNAGGLRALAFDFAAFKNAATPEDRRASVRAWLEGGEGVFTDIAFSPDGKTIAASSEFKMVHLWDAATGKSKLVIKDFQAPVWNVAFSPDGKTLVTASGGGAENPKAGLLEKLNANGVQFWSAENGRRLDGFGRESETGIITNLVGFRAAVFSPDGKYTAAGAFDGKVYLRDNETKTIRKFNGHTDLVNAVQFAKDARGNTLVISGGADSTARVWNAETGAEICALVSFRDGSWAVVETATGRYDAPNGGEIGGIQWVFGNETIALEQLKDIYYTPDLLPRLLGYNKEPLRDVPALAAIKLFPKIVEQKLDEKTARLTIKLQNRGGGIGAVRVLVNGKLATEDARDAQLKANPNQAEAIVTFDLKGSAGFESKTRNKIEVIANNYDASIKKGTLASRGSATVTLGDDDGNDSAPTLYAIVGGVSDYNGANIDLKFAAKDAEDFAHALGVRARRLFCPDAEAKCVDKVKIKTLSTSGAPNTSAPTKANFKQAFAEIAREARPEDILVVYLAGHGASLNLDGTDTYLYLTQEADRAAKSVLEKKEYRDAATISSTELLEWMTQEKWSGSEQRGIQALKQIMILDTCAAGAFEGKVSITQPRELSADQTRALERLKDRTGLQILMGSAADAVSYEATEYGQGLLTYALLQGLNGARLREAKFIDTQLLFGYAADAVPNYAANVGGIQRPRIFGAAGGIDIGMLDAKDAGLVRLESKKPVLARPSFVLKGETGADILDLTGEFRRLLNDAAAARKRGADDNEQTTRGAQLVFIDEDKYPGAFRVTGTYTEEANEITLAAFLWKDNKSPQPLDKITGKTAAEVGEKLLAAVLKRMPEEK